jgi:hypothetical protein
VQYVRPLPSQVSVMVLCSCCMYRSMGLLVSLSVSSCVMCCCGVRSLMVGLTKGILVRNLPT